MGYVTNYENVDGIFAVPTSVADRHLRGCSEAQLKVLLLALRAAPSPADPSAIARRLSLSEAEAADCLLYWANEGVLKSDGAAPSPAPTAPLPPPRESAPAPERTTEVAPTGQAVTVVHSRAKLTPTQINDMADADPHLGTLISGVQRVLGNPLSAGDTEILAWLYSVGGLSAEYLILAARYCRSIGRCRVRYLEQMVTGWMEKDVVTYAAAEAEIARLQARSRNEAQIREMFGLGERALSARERSSIALWYETYRTPPELIRLAYDRTVDNTGKVSFAYLGKILAKWYEKGVATPEAAEADLSAGRPGRAESAGGAYSTDEVRRKMEQRLFGETEKEK